MARIAIEGAITGSTRRRVLKALKEVQEREFPALLLRIDSPGGTVGDSQEIHAALLRLREKGCHVVASFGNISASGGVYVGVAAETIVSNPGTITGSIGVILRGNNLSKLLDRVGVKFETVKSGAFKDILSPDRALGAEERELLQALIDSSYEQFVAAVAEGRKLDPSPPTSPPAPPQFTRTRSRSNHHCTHIFFEPWVCGTPFAHTLLRAALTLRSIGSLRVSES